MRQSYTPGPRPTTIDQPILKPLPKTCGQCPQNKDGVCQSKARAGWGEESRVWGSRRGCGLRHLVEE